MLAKSVTYQSDPGPAKRFARVFSLSALLWLAPVLGDLIQPTPPSTDFWSPVVRNVLLLATAVSLVVATAIALLSLLAARLMEAFERSDAARGLSSATAGFVAIGASVAVLVCHETVHAWVARRGWPPESGLALLVLAGSVLAAVLVAGLRFAMRGPSIRMLHVSGFGAVAGWVAAALASTGHGDSGRFSIVVGICAVAAALLLVGRTTPRSVIAGLALVAAVVAVVARAPVAARVLASEPRTAPGGADNLLLILVDTLRADQTAFADYALETTPELARAAQHRATYFTKATAAAPATIPSVCALFTSSLDADFARRKRFEPVWLKSSASDDSELSDVWTAALAFNEAGYRTGCFSGTSTIDRGGFRIGFEEFSTTCGYGFYRSSFPIRWLLDGNRIWESYRRMRTLRLHKSDSEHTRIKAQRWMKGEDARPFFAYLHLLDPHWPYYDHGQGLLSEQSRDLEDRYSYIDLMRRPDRKGEKRRGTAQLRELMERHDEEVRWSDREIGALLADLDSSGLAASTLVVIVADHGEEFFEHGSFGHGHDVFEELIHVPLLFLWPDRPKFDSMPPRVEQPVSLMDVFPTVSDYLSLPAHDTPIRGHSLRPLLEGTHQGAWWPVVSLARGGRKMSYREGPLKVRLVRGKEPLGTVPNRVEVYDLERDPLERTALDGEDPVHRDLVSRALQAADSILARSESEPMTGEGNGANEASESEAVESLRALGYVE